MMCPPCKSAGEALRVAQIAATDAFRTQALMVANQRHMDCQAPGSCPCHHDISLDALQNPTS